MVTLTLEQWQTVEPLIKSSTDALERALSTVSDIDPEGDYSQLNERLDAVTAVVRCANDQLVSSLLHAAP